MRVLVVARSDFTFSQIDPENIGFIKVDPENKGLSEIDPENKGVSEIDPENKGLSEFILKTKDLVENHIAGSIMALLMKKGPLARSREAMLVVFTLSFYCSSL